jgi:hypothetical protein
MLLMLLPFAAYYYSEHLQTAGAVVVGAFAIAVLIPPIGWRRPHPYSDDPSNYPYPRKSD